MSKIVKQIQEEFQQKDTQTSKLDEMKKQLDENPANNEVRLQIAKFAMDNGIYDQAIENLLDVKMHFSFEYNSFRL